MGDKTAAVYSLVFCLEETHRESIRAEGSSWRRHRAEEPNCSYCAALDEGRDALKTKKKRRELKARPAGAHTPGEWVAKQKADHVTQAGGWVILYHAEPGHMARLDHGGEFSEANARVIAAAPSLIESLTRALEYFEAQEIEACENCPVDELTPDCDEHFCAFIKPRMLEARAALKAAKGEK